MNKMDEINNLISKIKKPKIQSIEETIKEKFNEISTYIYISDPNKLHPGTIIRYVSNDLTKLSNWGIITKKTFYKKTYGSKTLVKYITLLNNSNDVDFYWKIKPSKYYIFQSIGIKQNPLDDIINNFFNNDKLKDKDKIKNTPNKNSKSELDEYENILFQEIKKYNSKQNK